MKLLVILLMGLVFGLSAAILDVVTGGGVLSALLTYVVVGITVTFAGAALLVVRELVAGKVSRHFRPAVMASALAK